MSKIGPKTRQQVIDRDNGMCIMCPRAVPVQEVHHRRPRGMGSSKRTETNSPANLICLCGGHHRWVESHRDEAREMGWLVRQDDIPAEVPIFYRGRFVTLDDDAGIVEVA